MRTKIRKHLAQSPLPTCLGLNVVTKDCFVQACNCVVTSMIALSPFFLKFPFFSYAFEGA